MVILSQLRYDPLSDVPNDIEGEQDRVIFIRTVTQIIVRTIVIYIYIYFFILIQGY